MKRLTTAEKIRRYMEAHPNAMPKQIAEALGVKVSYIHVLRSSDKKRIAEGKPIRRIKRTRSKTVQFLGVTMAKDDVTNLTPEQTARLVEAATKPKARMQSPLDSMPKVGDSVGGLTLTRKALPDGSYMYRWVRDDLVASGKIQVDAPLSELPITMEEPKEDPVNHPAHYKVGGIETIDYIKAKLTPDEFRGYLKGNLLKYSSRIGHKGAAQLDAGKAGWYANALVQAIETQNA